MERLDWDLSFLKIFQLITGEGFQGMVFCIKALWLAVDERYQIGCRIESVIYSGQAGFTHCDVINAAIRACNELVDVLAYSPGLSSLCSTASAFAVVQGGTF